MTRAALRTSPQPEASLFRIHFGKIHWHAIKETPDFGHHLNSVIVSVLVQHEVSARGAVMDEAIRLNTAKCDHLSFGTLAVQAVPFQLHFQMMFVTKHMKVLARLGSRHVPSSRASPNAVRQQSVRQCHTLIPLHFGVVPQFVNSYASGFRLSRVVPRLHFKLVLLHAMAAQGADDREGIQLPPSDRDAIRTAINSGIDRALGIICTKSESIS
jgi:hypothetical protein